MAPYIDYYKGKYNIGDVFCEKVLSNFYDTVLLDALEDRKVLRFIGSEIPNRKWSRKDTFICGLGWRVKDAKLDPSWIDASNFCYVRGKISRQRVIDSGVNISPRLPIGDTGLLASLLYEPCGEKDIDILIITHYSAEKNHDKYLKEVQQHFPSKKIRIISMGDKSLSCDGLFGLITRARCVLASSLHAIIFSHSFGVPVVTFSDVDGYKFSDYYSVYDNIDIDFSVSISLKEAIARLSDTQYINGIQPKPYEVRQIQKNIVNAMPYRECFSKNGRNIHKKVNSYCIADFGMDNNCCGCGSCMNNCPSDAISVSVRNGFKYPVVSDACIHCGLCSNLCPVLNVTEDKPFVRHMGVFSLDDALRLRSSSGGVVPELMHYFIEQGAVCFGVAWMDNYNGVGHIVVRDKEDIEKVLGSKYIECRNFEINHFGLIKDLLKNDTKVLYVGTPCQIASLTQFIRANGVSTKRLFRVQIACFGVPSEETWREYRNNLGDVVSINFRDKRKGWKNYHVSIMTRKGERVESHKDNGFLKKFLSKKNLRPSCADCKFKTRRDTGADLTVGDMWGADVINVKHDNKGLSLVTIHNKYGCYMIDAIKQQIGVIKVDDSQYKQLKKYNGGI